jgi:hypothetical protein
VHFSIVLSTGQFLLTELYSGWNIVDQHQGSSDVGSALRVTFWDGRPFVVTSVEGDRIHIGPFSSIGC